MSSLFIYIFILSQPILLLAQLPIDQEPGALIIEVLRQENQLPIDYIILSQQIFNMQIVLRTNPVAFQNSLKSRAFNSAAAVINGTRAVGTLTYKGALRKAANLLIADQQRTGLTGHIGSDGSTPGRRINKFGTWSGCVGENAIYGPFDALTIMSGFINSPPHYRNLVYPGYTISAVACGTHPVYKHMCLIEYVCGGQF